MHIGNHRWTAHRAWSLIATAAAVALMLAVFAAPMSAAANKTHLSAASVSPRTGTPKTVVVVTVVYQNERKSPAESVTLHIGAQDHAMARVAGGDWRTGVTFRWSGKV